MSDKSEKSTRDLVVEIHTNVESLMKRGDDHEKRIRKLERNNWVAYGILVALTFFKENLKSGLPKFSGLDRIATLC